MTVATDTGEDAYLDHVEKAFLAFTSSDNDEAIRSCEQALKINPEGAEALFVLGLVSFLLDDLGRAIKFFERGHAREPDWREFADILSAMYSRVGDLSNSLYYSKLATTLVSNPTLKRYVPQGFDDFEENMKNVALSWYYVEAAVHFYERDYKKTIAYCERELGLNADNVDCLILLGRALINVNDIPRAAEVLAKAAHLAPDNPECWTYLSDALLAEGRIGEAMANIDKAMRIAPDGIDALCRKAISLMYGDQDAWRDYPGIIAKIGALVAATHKDKAAAKGARSAGDKPVSRPRGDDALHIGMIIGHAAITDKSELLIGLLSRLDPKRFKVFAYQQYTQTHPATLRLEKEVHHWRGTFNIDDDTLFRIMQNDALDLIVDTCAVQADHRLAVLARGPAPVRVSWLGTPLAAPKGCCDVILSCDDMLDIDRRDGGGVACESLGSSLFAYSGGPTLVTPGSDKTPVARKGFITFGGVLDLARMQSAIPLWADVLRRVKRSRLLLGGGLEQRQLWPLVADAFSQTGLLERISIQDDEEGVSPRGHFLSDIDILLDTPDVNGLGEICDALWMGVPVVALKGDRRASLMGKTILKASGNARWCADDAAQYVDIACALADDRAQLRQLRRGLREQLKKSPLLDVQGFADTLAELFERLARR
ncbi:tetratricopeptide repeat protein [Varunaivibrio sulfuroxidans]|uniref:protein O-GlcNAc transferase n=1 Tax=Varunaivibrio sulfuroxidans TaxID=1773489 RepID=A0A4R3J9A3_9PROT|nr:glycosyltransferase family 41 protein [Varunaivibrio sulfuroxidans]TCS62142.1 putative O-linked N-acetylglucosamine transferase (SPINDLY family) [Varunaivibrio sulfuroxidans]WES30573.1 tetratricopeptide repeat protein [Varunaivibrio sulfuroxidans]